MRTLSFISLIVFSCALGCDDTKPSSTVDMATASTTDMAGSSGDMAGSNADLAGLGSACPQGSSCLATCTQGNCGICISQGSCSSSCGGGTCPMQCRGTGTCNYDCVGGH